MHKSFSPLEHLGMFLKKGTNLSLNPHPILLIFSISVAMYHFNAPGQIWIASRRLCYFQ